jgi:putative transposase
MGRESLLRWFWVEQRFSAALSEFAIMPHRFHALLKPSFTLGKAVQFIKGGFSYRAKKELGFGGEVWETTFYDRR